MEYVVAAFDIVTTHLVAALVGSATTGWYITNKLSDRMARLEQDMTWVKQHVTGEHTE